MDINIVKLKKYASVCSVLYVEDDEVIRTQTASFLGRFFPDVILAEDGAIGLEKYKEREFDVVITDINMPNMTGIEMIEAIKEINYNQTILVTSAHNDSEYLMSLINLNVTRFVLKPFNNKQFLYVLYKVAEELASAKEQERLQSEIDNFAKKSQIIVDQVKIGIVILKDNKIDMANKAFLDIGGFDSYETLILEMPEIGVLFEEASRCINAATNAELIEQLESLDEDEKKVRIMRDATTNEYHATSTKFDDENSYVLTFSDITAIHDSLHQDKDTKLPAKKFLLEEIEIFKQSKSSMNVILLSLKLFGNIAKWYGKNVSKNIEVEFASIIKTLIKDQVGNTFIGSFGENKIVVIPYEDETTKLTDEIKKLDLSSLDLILKRCEKGVDFQFVIQSRLLKLDLGANMIDVEVDLVNGFDLFQ